MTQKSYRTRREVIEQSYTNNTPYSNNQGIINKPYKKSYTSIHNRTQIIKTSYTIIHNHAKDTYINHTRIIYIYKIILNHSEIIQKSFRNDTEIMQKSYTIHKQII